MEDTNFEQKVLGLLAEQNKKIADLTERLAKLETVTAVDGVIYEGSPEYVREYLDKEITKPKGGS